MKKLLIITSLLIIVLVVLRFTSTKIGEISREKSLKMNSAPVVELKEVEEKEIFKTIEFPGRVQSQDKVDIIARVDGYLQKKHFQEGNQVKKGQVLFTIEPTQYLNNLNKAKADLENAKAILYKATRDYDRGSELVKKDFISKSTYDGLKADKDAAIAQVKSLEAVLAEARRNYGYTRITAPVSGKIGSLQIQEGNYVSAQSGTLATITKTTPIYVKYSVDSKQFETLKKEEFIPKKGAQPVMVDVILPSGTVYPIKGVQDFFDNQISLNTGTIDFRATFKNEDGTLIPGDFVKVRVYSNLKSKVFIVPQEVVQQDSKGKYVYVTDEHNTVQTKYFKDKGQYENYWIIESGLNKGDKFIATNITKLMPKMPVKIAAPKAPSEENNKDEVQQQPKEANSQK